MDQRLLAPPTVASSSRVSWLKSSVPGDPTFAAAPGLCEHSIPARQTNQARGLARCGRRAVWPRDFALGDPAPNGAAADAVDGGKIFQAERGVDQRRVVGKHERLGARADNGRHWCFARVVANAEKPS